MPETFHEWFPLLVVFLVTRSWLRPSTDTEASLATREPRGHQKKSMFPICFIGGFDGKLFGPQRRLTISKIDNIDAWTARAVVTIDFYRSIDKMDMNQFRLACFYRLLSSCCNSRRDTKLTQPYNNVGICTIKCYVFKK